MTEKEKLASAIAAQESMRPMLGDAVVDISVAALREKLASLDDSSDTEQRKLVTIPARTACVATRRVASIP